MIKKYVKKPVVISAVQFNGENIDEISYFANDGKYIGYSIERDQYFIRTLEGDHYITNGDFIIRGVEGEYYPCKAEIFKKTYDEI